MKSHFRRNTSFLWNKISLLRKDSQTCTARCSSSSKWKRTWEESILLWNRTSTEDDDRAAHRKVQMWVLHPSGAGLPNKIPRIDSLQRASNCRRIDSSFDSSFSFIVCRSLHRHHHCAYRRLLWFWWMTFSQTNRRARRHPSNRHKTISNWLGFLGWLQFALLYFLRCHHPSIHPFNDEDDRDDVCSIYLCMLMCECESPLLASPHRNRFLSGGEDHQDQQLIPRRWL